MIFTPFCSKILIKDYEFSEDWNKRLISTLKYLSLNKEEYCEHFLKLKDKNYSEILKFDKHKDSKPYVISERNGEKFPIIKELRNLFLECFIEYNKSFETKENDIKKKFLSDDGNFAIIKTGQRVGLHEHPSQCFAIFYLTDVDNEKNGGELLILDPSFNTQKNFCNEKYISIETKKHRMVVASSYLWHEVTPYYGNSERMCAVIDLGRK